MNILQASDFNLAESFMERYIQNQDQDFILSTEILRINKFETIHSFEKKVLLKIKHDELEFLYCSIEDKYNKYQKLRRNIDKVQKQKKKKYLRMILLDELIGELINLESKTDELQVDIIKVNKSLIINEQNKKKYQERIEDKKDSLEQYLVKNEIISLENENNIKNFAQNIILNKLIELSNKYMVLFGSTYELKRIILKKNIEVEVFPAIESKLCPTTYLLSSTESSKVSLSLALAFCCLGSKKISIDSLFLEKDIKSLNQENLELALKTFNSFVNVGKDLSIISYLDDLKNFMVLKIVLVREFRLDSVLCK